VSETALFEACQPHQLMGAVTMLNPFRAAATYFCN
jgi:hypothetical protein